MKPRRLTCLIVQRRLAASLMLWVTLLSVARIVLNPDVLFPSHRPLSNSSGGPKLRDRAPVSAPALPCENRLVFKDLSSNLKIPRIIHFTAKSEFMLNNYKRYLKRWYESYSNFTFYLWRDADALCLLRLHYPELLEEFESELQTPLERSDFIRALALYHFGGLYVDMDTLPVRSMEHLFDNPMRGAMVAQEPEEHAVFLYNLKSLVSNAVMFGIPKHPFYYYYVCKMLAKIRNLSPSPNRMRTNFEATHITGPILMKQVHENYTQLGLCPAEQLNCSVHLFKPDEFSPNYDTSQKRRIRYTCIRRYRTLNNQQRRLCNSLLYRRFANRRLTQKTFAVHDFRHFSTNKQKRKSSKNRQKGLVLHGPLFNAFTVIPTLKQFNSTEEQC